MGKRHTVLTPSPYIVLLIMVCVKLIGTYLNKYSLNFICCVLNNQTSYFVFMTPLELDKDSFAHKPAEEGLGVGWHSSGHFGWLGEVSSLKIIKYYYNTVHV